MPTTFPIDKTRFLVTGGAGFIGSNIVAFLLSHQANHVRVLDNMSTGSFENILPFMNHKAFEFKKGDIKNLEDCMEACTDIDIVLHTAALGSVPRSLANPVLTNEVNVGGFVNLLVACKENKVKRIVFSSSSSVYGFNEQLPMRESYPAMPISPYAVSKYANELYAQVFYQNYGLEYIGLRYFNVFGPNQNVRGPYAAVIPVFITSLLQQKPPIINGDGNISRDFTYVYNVVQANILAAFVQRRESVNQIYNISGAKRVSINEMYWKIVEYLDCPIKPVYGPNRKGDIKNSLADITKAKTLLGYQPAVAFEDGLAMTIDWYKEKLVFVEKPT